MSLTLFARFLIAICFLAVSTTQAAIITFSFDLNDFAVGTSPIGPFYNIALGSSNAPGRLAGPADHPSLSTSYGDYFRFGIDVTVTDNNGLGLTAFGLGLSNPNPGALAIVTKKGVLNPPALTSLTGTVNVNTLQFESLFSSGFSNGHGGIDPDSGIFGSVILSSGRADASLHAYFGADGPEEIATIVMKNQGFGGILSLSDFPTGIQVATESLDDPTNYGVRTVNGSTDTIAPLPQLFVATQEHAFPEPSGVGGALIGGFFFLTRRTQNRSRCGTATSQGC